MTRIYMIRHGKAAAGWDGNADPGLNELGRAQAEAASAGRWLCRYIPARSNVAKKPPRRWPSLGRDAAN